MAYNNRMSQQFHGSQQHGRGRKKEDENDALMRLVRSQHPYYDFPSYHLLTSNLSRIKRLQAVLMILAFHLRLPT